MPSVPVPGGTACAITAHGVPYLAMETGSDEEDSGGGPAAPPLTPRTRKLASYDCSAATPSSARRVRRRPFIRRSPYQPTPTGGNRISQAIELRNPQKFPYREIQVRISRLEMLTGLAGTRSISRRVICRPKVVARESAEAAGAIQHARTVPCSVSQVAKATSHIDLADLD